MAIKRRDKMKMLCMHYSFDVVSCVNNYKMGTEQTIDKLMYCRFISISQPANYLHANTCKHMLYKYDRNLA